MGSHLNFKSFGDLPLGEGNGGKLPGGLPLARQSSLYSLTFDELQHTFSGLGKDFGSMNMDELLKSIWTSEGSQAVTSSAGGAEGNVTGGNLQRQGSLTLPRTLSQKTVDEVWRDFMKDSVPGVKDGSGGGGSNVPQRQLTLGEMTLEEFLARAGVVREDALQIGRPIDSGFYAELSKPNNNAGFVLGFQQPNRSSGLIANRMIENNNPAHLQPPTLSLNGGGIRLSQQHPQHLHHHQPMQQQPLQQLQQQPIFSKQATVKFSSPMHLASSAQLSSPAARPSAVGMADPSMNNNLAQVSGLQSGGMKMVGLGSGGVTVASGSPASQLSPDVIGKSSVDTLSPVPYVFGRGRKVNSAVEKVVERRQRRMIKNRESAARSRARKQAYTLELEAEIAKLKELNQELQRKQVEIMEMQKDQILESVQRPRGLKRRCLRRTFTGPW
ncbi:ABSCISIC ACID-INSENSITIVE 5-like protein 7 [Tripterygium wilfordii]|uniref:ABSCISIC ACID-INSENSITIVE 5-like protein 7 n=1 Tax=Tripterygium wilfordii TaxID=458696 RepID=A0A7J7DGZ6_TRIWF|nr:bZIP transcription factor TRAB1-like [Tripterygium wilfordii]KAF5745621.1 ABSCISIC ACID-INSENSITIVE 5-like protein 7 [Tripterygium wilfordii]